MTMPAVVLTADRTIALQERPRPSLRPDQVIVEVELCGICGYQTLLAMTMNVARTAAFTGGEAAPFGPPD